LVNEISLYYDARSKKHQNISLLSGKLIVQIFVFMLL